MKYYSDCCGAEAQGEIIIDIGKCNRCKEMSYFEFIPSVEPILVGCEESGVITSEFRKQGYEAYSCDLKPTRGDDKWHYQEDIMNILPLREWGIIILHPDCTALAVSGNKHYGEGKPKHHKRIEAIKWTTNLWSIAKENGTKVALENPVSVIFKHLDYDELQYIQPWQFGHGETKRTGFALYNLPKLKPTNIVEGRKQRVWKMGPSKNRKRDRSTTYQGIAEAIVDQWTK